MEIKNTQNTNLVFCFDPNFENITSIKNKVKNELPNINNIQIYINSNTLFSSCTSLNQLYTGQLYILKYSQIDTSNSNINTKFIEKSFKFNLPILTINDDKVN